MRSGPFRRMLAGPAVLLALGVPPALADPVMECSLTTSSQVETAECLAEVEARVDAVMGQALGFSIAAARELDAVTGRAVALPALETAQAAWDAYRDAHCDHVGASFGGGSGTGIAIRSCRIELARARSDTLMSLAR